MVGQVGQDAECVLKLEYIHNTEHERDGGVLRERNLDPTRSRECSAQPSPTPGLTGPVIFKGRFMGIPRCRRNPVGPFFIIPNKKKTLLKNSVFCLFYLRSQYFLRDFCKFATVSKFPTFSTFSTFSM